MRIPFGDILVELSNRLEGFGFASAGHGHMGPVGDESNSRSVSDSDIGTGNQGALAGQVGKLVVRVAADAAQQHCVLLQ